MRLIAFPQWDKLTSLLRGMARQSTADYAQRHPYPTFLMRAFEAASDSALVLAELPADTSAIPG